MKFLGVPDWIVLAVTALALLYMYAARYRNYWKKQNVVHENFSLIFSAVRRMMPRPSHLRDQDRYLRFGKVFGAYEDGKPMLFVADPELVRLVLVKDFPSLPNRRIINFFDPLLDNMLTIAPAEKWRRIRPAASPAFSTGKLRKALGEEVRSCGHHVEAESVHGHLAELEECMAIP
ncbi:cytochrome P450 3A25-like [Ixodes scapularis]